MPALEARLAWTPLAWDTEYFGFAIGRADLAGATPDSLAALDVEASQAGIRCLYGSHPPDDPALSSTVQEAGWNLLDATSRFQLDTGDPFHPDPGQCTVRLGQPDDLPAMQETVRSLGPWSRFSVDRRFGRTVAERLQVLGVERAAGDGRLLVAEVDGAVHAFLTRSTEPGPTIDTIATIAPGSRAVDALVVDTRAWAGDQPLSVAWVAARNIPCFRLFARLGFRVAEVRYQYHRWLG